VPVSDPGPAITAAGPSEGAELAALIAELKGLRRDLGGSDEAQAAAPKPGEPPPAVVGLPGSVPLPAGFAEIESELAAARQAGDEEQEESLLLKATNQLIDAGHYSIAERLALRMVELAGSDPGDVPFAYGQLGLAQYRQGKFTEAIASYQKAEAVYRTLYDRMLKLPDSDQVIGFRSHLARLLGMILMRIGNVHKAAKDYNLGQDSYEQAMQLYEAHERESELATLLLNYGGMESSRGNYEQAIGLLNRGLEIVRKSQNADAEAEFLVNLGNAQSRSGDNLAALAQYQLAYDKLTPNSDYMLRSALLGNWSTSLMEEGHHARARDLLRELQTIVRPEDEAALKVLEFLPVLNKTLAAPPSP
jgi:tetratricopeptide (TPR) repeat protein